MKRILFLMLFLGLADAVIAQSDTSKCSSFKRGRFTYTNDSAQLIYIRRKGRIQQETIPETGVMTRLKIKWISACVYEITQVWSSSKALRKRNGSSTRVHITSTAKYSYEFSCACPHGGGPATRGIIYMINPGS